jgi:amidophosphoribosyltransferase
MHKDMGLVSHVFNEDVLASMPGNLAVGHTRYSTSGASVLRNAQPVYCTSTVGDIAVAHNGNLINAVELRSEMESEGEVFDSTSDSEVMARLIVRNLAFARWSRAGSAADTWWRARPAPSTPSRASPSARSSPERW